jgi:hypothetical protein
LTIFRKNTNHIRGKTRVSLILILESRGILVIKFSKGSIAKDTYEDFTIRLSDHSTGISRGSSKKHIFVSSNFDNEESVKSKIDDF